MGESSYAYVRVRPDPMDKPQSQPCGGTGGTVKLAFSHLRDGVLLRATRTKNKGTITMKNQSMQLITKTNELTPKSQNCIT